MPDDAALPDHPTCLVTGATGYIGSRLVPRLLDAGHPVRVLARTPSKLDDVPWRDDVEVVEGDLTDVDSLREAFADADVVFHLVHSMGGSEDFEEEEADSARNVAATAEEQGVSRLVYLGGLHPEDADSLSTHLRSRIRVGEILIESSVPTMVFQAGVVIGSGSASFELIRHLTDRLPVMTTPRWVHNRIQPIAIRDILHYLAAAPTADLPTSRTYDVGGPDVMTYGEMMSTYAEVAGLGRRHMVVLRPLTPGLASRWVGLVTPIPPKLARPLIESLECDAVADDHDVDAVIPPPEGGLLSYREAVRLAIDHAQQGHVGSSWDEADPLGRPAEPLPSDPDWSGELVFSDASTTLVDAPEDDVWAAARRLAGTDIALDQMTPAPTGIFTRLVGRGPLRRGRRADRPSGTWSIGEDDVPNVLRLRADVEVPGELWLELRVAPSGRRAGTLHGQRLVFAPRGLSGILWWQGMLPWRRMALGKLADGLDVRSPEQ
ncbi:NAD(P)H-binding protein [Salsipaludibacter albus]|uniref:NAD(P)H-binding protein n=1 Tax=Salsipaludibacter albus TaxID=2849650 RepID=UPI001EE3AA6B|nr:NAD(P)H-binding protein [Salsipaludibacter albus]MBY5162689.1 NAD(P)H-binding protein [Salsipaludibacter albus]